MKQRLEPFVDFTPPLFRIDAEYLPLIEAPIIQPSIDFKSSLQSFCKQHKKAAVVIDLIFNDPDSIIQYEHDAKKCVPHHQFLSWAKRKGLRRKDAIEAKRQIVKFLQEC